MKGVSPAAIEEHGRTERSSNANYDEWDLFRRLHTNEANTIDVKANNNGRFQRPKIKNSARFLES